MFGIANPVIREIWDVFGHGTYTDVLMDDNNFFDEKWNFESYKEHLKNENINGIENVRFVYMDFPNRHPLLIRRFMTLWKAAAHNDDKYRPQLLTVLIGLLKKDIPKEINLADISFKRFLSSPIVKVSLDFVIPDMDILFYGIDIIKLEKPDLDKNSRSSFEIFIEKFVVPEMSMKQAWDYFGQEDEILVFQNPTACENSIPSYFRS